MKRTLPVLALLAVVGVLLPGCGLWPAESNPYTTTDVATDMGEAINSVYLLVTWVTMIVWVVVFGLLGYIIWRYRDDGSPGNPEQVHGNIQLEIGWTLIPVALVIIMIVPTIRTVFQLADAAPEDAEEIRVVGKRFWWQFEYPDHDIITASEMHIPAGVPVSLALESDSVIHSFWVPRFGGKRDNIPGRINRMWFTVQDIPERGQPEIYRGECAEYCGEAHALMRFDVVVHHPDDYEDWLQKMQEPTYEALTPEVRAAGEEAFAAGGCIACHAVEGLEGATARRGPDLTYFGERKRLASGVVLNTEENLALWLRDVDAIKPGTSDRFDGMNLPAELTDEQVDALVTYLLSLK